MLRKILILCFIATVNIYTLFHSPYLHMYLSQSLSLDFYRWAVILAFDVRVERDAQEMADSLGVKVFSADIIYHLFDAFLKHRQVCCSRANILCMSRSFQGILDDFLVCN